MWRIHYKHYHHEDSNWVHEDIDAPTAHEAARSHRSAIRHTLPRPWDLAGSGAALRVGASSVCQASGDEGPVPDRADDDDPDPLVEGPARLVGLHL